MRIIIAEDAGACYGVNRALTHVRAAVARGEDIYTFGPLIHNPQVVAELEANGVCECDDLDEVEPGNTLVIRAHGVTPQVIEQARDKGLHLDDATCPHVSKAQQAAQELHDSGYFVIVVGEEGHPEVEGIRARATGTVAVVACPDDLPEALPERVGVVVQTTQTQAALDAVVAALEKRCDEVVVRNTICDATRKRQESAERLASQVDCMIVIGGRNSGNTRRLYEICRKRCENTHHIETPMELEDSWFTACEVVGVTGGASTPETQINAVASAIEGMGCDRHVV